LRIRLRRLKVLVARPIAFADRATFFRSRRITLNSCWSTGRLPWDRGARFATASTSSTARCLYAGHPGRTFFGSAGACYLCVRANVGERVLLRQRADGSIHRRSGVVRKHREPSPGLWRLAIRHSLRRRRNLHSRRFGAHSALSSRGAFGNGTAVLTFVRLPRADAAAGGCIGTPCSNSYECCPADGGGAALGIACGASGTCEACTTNGLNDPCLGRPASDPQGPDCCPGLRCVNLRCVP
jgi:hypothetical protein